MTDEAKNILEELNKKYPIDTPEQLAAVEKAIMNIPDSTKSSIGVVVSKHLESIDLNKFAVPNSRENISYPHAEENIIIKDTKKPSVPEKTDIKGKMDALREPAVNTEKKNTLK